MVFDVHDLNVKGRELKVGKGRSSGLLQKGRDGKGRETGRDRKGGQGQEREGSSLS